MPPPLLQVALTMMLKTMIASSTPKAAEGPVHEMLASPKMMRMKKKPYPPDYDGSYLNMPFSTMTRI